MTMDGYNSYPPTPQLSPHARARCTQMGLNTKRAKRVLQNADVRRAANTPVSRGNRMLAKWDGDPEICVVYEPGDPDVIITVIWNTGEKYVRPEVYSTATT